jgi:hypothetical protein
MKLTLEGQSLGSSPARRVCVEEYCDSWDAAALVENFQSLMLAWGYPPDVVDEAFLSARRVGITSKERHDMTNIAPKILHRKGGRT